MHENINAFSIDMRDDGWVGIEPMAAFAADGAMCAVTNADKEVSLLDSRRDYAHIASLPCRDSVMATVLGENRAAVVSTNQCVTWDLRHLDTPLFIRNIPHMNCMPRSLELAPLASSNDDTLVFHLGSTADNFAVHSVPLNPVSGPILYDTQRRSLSGLFDGGDTVVSGAHNGQHVGCTRVFTHTYHRDDAGTMLRHETRRVTINDFWSDRAFRHRDGTLYVCGHSGIARVSPEWTVELVSREELDGNDFLLALVDRTVIVASNGHGVHVNIMDAEIMSPMLRKFNVM